MRLPTAAVMTILASAGALAQVPLSADAIAIRTHEALVALDRYLETWNSRDPATWATSLHFPHVRPGAGPFEMTRTPQEYAAGVNFDATLKTGWHHSEWVSREVLQVGVDKVHAAGVWQRYTADDKPLASSAITYIITNRNGRWGVQARFAAGATGAGTTQAGSPLPAVAALSAFMDAWNSDDSRKLADAIHYPHVRINADSLEIWKTAQEFLAGPEPGRQRTWHQTRIEQSKIVQVTATGVNITVTLSHLGRDGTVVSKDEGVFLVALRDGVWKVQARSTMGS